MKGEYMFLENLFLQKKKKKQIKLQQITEHDFN